VSRSSAAAPRPQRARGPRLTGRAQARESASPRGSDEAQNLAPTATTTTACRRVRFWRACSDQFKSSGLTDQPHYSVVSARQDARVSAKGSDACAAHTPIASRSFASANVPGPWGGATTTAHIVSPTMPRLALVGLCLLVPLAGCGGDSQPGKAKSIPSPRSARPLTMPKGPRFWKRVWR
jgi:hypothetical protein